LTKPLLLTALCWIYREAESLLGAIILAVAKSSLPVSIRGPMAIHGRPAHWARYIVAVIALFLVWWMLRLYVL
jgi:hypothetical protein